MTKRPKNVDKNTFNWEFFLQFSPELGWGVVTAAKISAENIRLSSSTEEFAEHFSYHVILWAIWLVALPWLAVFSVDFEVVLQQKKFLQNKKVYGVGDPVKIPIINSDSCWGLAVFFSRVEIVCPSRFLFRSLKTAMKGKEFSEFLCGKEGRKMRKRKVERWTKNRVIIRGLIGDSRRKVFKWKQTTCATYKEKNLEAH
jgi:hypothetical protein